MPPKKTFMDKLELKRRVAEGLANRRKSGEMPGLDDSIARPDPRGAHFTKEQRKLFGQLCEIAIASLAQRYFDDWWDAINRIGPLMVEANFQKTVVLHTFKMIEHQAVAITGDKGLYATAQAELAHRRGKVYSIPKGLAIASVQDKQESSK